MTKNFWKDKRVLITGHTGFKGSWLALWLDWLGARVMGYSLPPPTTPSFFEAAGLSKKIETVTADVRDFERLNRAISDHRPEIVVHMAAQAIVRESHRDPMNTVTTNVVGTLNILEAVRKAGFVKVFLNVTSDKCYENAENIRAHAEEDKLGGRDTYSASKACAEILTAAYQDSFFNGRGAWGQKVFAATARAGNVIGGGDWAADRLVPDVIRAIGSKQPLFIRYPQAVRPWQHVLDALNGYLLLIQNMYENGDGFCGAWNFGPDVIHTKTVSWVVATLTRALGSNLQYSTPTDHGIPESGYLALDSSKARTKLGWNPKIGADEAVRLTAEWIQAFWNASDMRQISLRHIQQFTEMPVLETSRLPILS